MPMLPTRRWLTLLITATGRRFVMAKAKNKEKFKSDAFASIHASASSLRNVGAISKQTMREYDDLCLSSPTKMAPASIKQLRLKYQVSQPLFARYLNTSESTVEKWETGAKHPSGLA